MRRAAILVLVLACGCRKEEDGRMVSRDIEPPRGSQAWKVRNARSAAPLDVSLDATILDWPPNDTTPGETLVHGGNGWTCFPDNPVTPADDPACADDVVMQWVTAFQRRERPRVSAMGVSYQLRGGNAASWTEPFKMTPDSGQPWLEHPPFIVIVMPNPARSFAGLPTSPDGHGGPWVMLAGTPYAHLMVPVSR